jgi:hypothetical protein
MGKQTLRPSANAPDRECRPRRPPAASATAVSG